MLSSEVAPELKCENKLRMSQHMINASLVVLLHHLPI